MQKVSTGNVGNVWAAFDLLEQLEHQAPALLEVGMRTWEEKKIMQKY